MKNRLITLIVTLTIAITALAADPQLECMKFFGEKYLRMPDTKVTITSGTDNKFYSISSEDNPTLAKSIEQAVEIDRRRAFNTVESYTDEKASLILNIQLNNATISVGFSRYYDDDDNAVRLFVSGPPEAFK